MTETQSSVFQQNLQEAAHPFDAALAEWQVEIAEAKAKVEREPKYKLIEIDAGLANAAALLHVAYKSSAFEDNDYQEEIFKKSIGSGGDQVLIQKILDQIAICHEQIVNLRLQLAGGNE